jgi:hypothetical protein
MNETETEQRSVLRQELAIVYHGCQDSSES